MKIVLKLHDGDEAYFEILGMDQAKARAKMAPWILKYKIGQEVQKKVASGVDESLVGQLRQLGDLHTSWVLTDDEFATAKAKLLG